MLDVPAPTDAATAGEPPLHVGVFDSGVGGLSVLGAIHRRLPTARLHYLADSAWAPYGERPAAQVRERSLRLAQALRDAGAQVIVVACNTATALAIDTLRDAHPGVPLVGVEPGVRPAVAHTRNHRVGVMATPGTIASDRLRALVARERGRAQVTLVACDGLAAAIEQGTGPDGLGALLDRHTAPLRAAGVDTVALGCTHYPFVMADIAARLPGVHLVDTAEAIARQVGVVSQSVRRAMAGRSPVPDDPTGAVPRIRLQSTGDTDTLQRLAALALGTGPDHGVWPAVRVAL